MSTPTTERATTTTPHEGRTRPRRGASSGSRTRDEDHVGASPSSRAAAGDGTRVGVELVEDPAPRPADEPLIGVRTGTHPSEVDDGPVTGQLPAIAVLAGHLSVSTQRDVAVVSLDGGLDRPLAEQVAPMLAGLVANAEAVVLDLDQVALLDQRGLTHLVEALDRASDDRERCIVASRLSGRLVLERWGLTTTHAVFTSVPDALQARAFAAGGYGGGWEPTHG